MCAVLLVQRRDQTGARNASWTWKRSEQEVRRSSVDVVVIVAFVVEAVVVFVVLQTEVIKDIII